MNFWQKIKKPLFVMAPMANVTDSVFRGLFAKYGKPSVMWTEFVSADGLVSAGRKKLLVDLKFSPRERPIVAQLFGRNPEVMKKAARMVAELGFDGIDLNMGCPDRSVEKQGGGAAMIKDPAGAVEVLLAARAGVMAASKSPRKVIPVSIKTRIGYNKVEMGWLRLLLEQRLPVLTVHLRTRKEMSDVPAHWELMPEIVRLRDEVSPETLIIGNGDVESVADGLAKIAASGCDGAMIGRGIFGKPWLFDDKSHEQTPTEHTPAERLKIMVEHAKAFDKEYCGRKKQKSFAVMRKHFKAYVSDWDGAKELRTELMTAENSREVAKIVNKHLLAVKKQKL